MLNMNLELKADPKWLRHCFWTSWNFSQIKCYTCSRCILFAMLTTNNHNIFFREREFFTCASDAKLSDLNFMLIVLMAYIF